MFQFKKMLLSILGKFNSPQTQQQASDELKNLMKIHITDNERMVSLLSQLGVVNDHMNTNQIKEQFKQFGVAAEIFEEALIPFL